MWPIALVVGGIAAACVGGFSAWAVLESRSSRAALTSNVPPPADPHSYGENRDQVPAVHQQKSGHRTSYLADHGSPPNAD